MLDGDFNLKIVDFGFSTTLAGDGSGFLKTLSGTPRYQAPEIIRGDKYNGIKSDIYSLGVILFMM